MYERDQEVFAEQKHQRFRGQAHESQRRVGNPGVEM